MPPVTRRYNRLRIKSLKFISAVDHGAQGPISSVALIKRAGNTDEFTAVCKVALASEPLGIVFGWALASTVDGGQTPHVDLQDDAVVGDDELIRIAAAFMEDGAASDVMHDDTPDGRVIFCLPLTSDVLKALNLKSDVHGLAIGMKPSAETFARFMSKELGAFSIAGTGEREPVEMAAPKCPSCGAYPTPPLWASNDTETCGICGKPMKLPATQPMKAAPSRRVRKHAVLTSAAAGHQHQLYPADVADAVRTLRTTYDLTKGAAEGDEHTHPWVFDAATGKITLAMVDGHSHDVAAVVPTDVLKVAAGRAPAPVARTPAALGFVTVTYAGPGPGAPLGKAQYVTDIRKHLDELPDDTERVRIARLNPAAPWAAEWIEKGIEMDKQAKQATDIEKQRAAVEITFEKSSSIVKSLIAKRQTALEAHDAFLAKVARERKTSVHAAMSALLTERDTEYYKLYEAQSDAHDAVCRAGEHIAAPKIAFIAKQLDDVNAEMRAAEESFCLAHNLDSHVATERLAKISPTYRALYEKQAQLGAERDLARSQAKRMVMDVHAKMAGDAVAAKAAAAETELRAKESPADRVFREHVERYAKANGIAYPVAVAKALDDDPTARSLYELTASERRAS
jgi:hypothetical protein